MLIRRTLASSRRSAVDEVRPPSRRARGGGPGYVSWAATWTRSAAADRQVRVEVEPRPEAAVVPVVAGPRLVRDEPDPEILAARAGRTAPPPAPGTARRASRGRRAGDRAGRRTGRPRPRADRRAARRPGRSASIAAAAVVEDRLVAPDRRPGRSSARRARGRAVGRRPAPRRGSASATTWAVSQSRRSGSATSAAIRSSSAAGILDEAARRPELLDVDLRPSGRPGRSSRRRGPGCAGRGAGRGGGSRGRSGPGPGPGAAPPTATVVACVGRVTAASPGTEPIPWPGRHAPLLADERHALALDRVEAHPQRRRLRLGDLADVGRLLVGGHRPAADDLLRLADHQPGEVVAIHRAPGRDEQVVAQLEPGLERRAASGWPGAARPRRRAGGSGRSARRGSSRRRRRG